MEVLQLIQIEISVRNFHVSDADVLQPNRYFRIDCYKLPRRQIHRNNQHSRPTQNPFQACEIPSYQRHFRQLARYRIKRQRKTVFFRDNRLFSSSKPAAGQRYRCRNYVPTAVEDLSRYRKRFARLDQNQPGRCGFRLDLDFIPRSGEGARLNQQRSAVARYLSG